MGRTVLSQCGRSEVLRSTRSACDSPMFVREIVQSKTGGRWQERRNMMPQVQASEKPLPQKSYGRQLPDAGYWVAKRVPIMEPSCPVPQVRKNTDRSPTAACHQLLPPTSQSDCQTVLKCLVAQ